MLNSNPYQFSFLVASGRPPELAENSVEVMLHDRIEDIATREEFAHLYHPFDGAPSHDPLRIFALLLLQFVHGVSDREAIRRAKADLHWRYSMRLKGNDRAPSKTTLIRFRRALHNKWGESGVHERVLAFAVRKGVLDDTELQAVDSTNTNCRGAVLDTYNLISRHIREALIQFASVTDREMQPVAQQFDALDYMGRSVKGQVDIDWSLKSDRHALVTRLVRDGLRIADALLAFCEEHSGDFGPLLVAVDRLKVVATQDVEKLTDGTYQISKGTAKGRIISVTDPEAGHGRKSASKRFDGFRTHAMATLLSRLVTSIWITGAGTHDAEPTTKLIELAAELVAGTSS